MATKPAKLPRWATTGTKTEPTEGKKDSGYITSEKPSAQVFNWILNTIYLWCAWLDDLANQAFTWTLAHTFQAGVVVTNSTTNGVGVTATGNGNGAGGSFTGGASATRALLATATGTSAGVEASSVNGYAVQASTTGTGAGVYGQSMSGSGGVGVHGFGNGDEYAAKFANSGTTKPAVDLNGGTAGALYATCNQGTTVTLDAYYIGSTSQFSPLRIMPRGTAVPTTGQHEVGELYVTTAGKLYICTVAGTPGTWTVVGTQT